MNLQTSTNVVPFRPRNASVEAVVYWVNAAGYMMMAPHTKMKPFPGWNRVEMTTVHEIEAFSRRFAKQEADKIKNMKADEHLRNIKRRNDMRTACRLRIAQGHSEADVMMNRRILESLERQDNALLKAISEDSTMVTGCLEIEKHDNTTLEANKAQYGKKSMEIE